MKKTLYLFILVVIVLGILAGCSSQPSNGFNTDKSINVVSREDGSGTRGAFVELVGILEKDSSGKEVDRTYEEAIIQNSTDAVMTTVAGDKYAIGYISLGSLNGTVNALNVEGVEATGENVKNGTYKIARPFNVAYKGELSGLAKDFMDFILSKEGQDIVIKGKYVSINDNLESYIPSGQSGNLVIAGSTSVTPIMEKLVESYKELNPDVNIEIQSTGSSAGMQSAMEGTADIGMASRDLKESELAILKTQIIALDGIAIVVNRENTISNITMDQIKAIYTGEITKWSEVAK